MKLDARLSLWGPQIRRALEILIPLTCFSFIGLILFRSSNEVSLRALSEHWGWIACAVGLSLSRAVLSFLIWYVLLRLQVLKAGLNQAYRIYCAAVLAKFLPGGKVLQFVALGASHPPYASASISALVLSSFLGLLAGLPIALPGLSKLSNSIPPIVLGSITIGSLGLLFIGLNPSFLLFPVRLFRPKMGSISLPRRLPPRIFVSAVSLSITGWLLIGVTQIFILRGMGHNPGSGAIWVLMTSIYLSTWAAYLAFFTPMGLGVTEGVIYALLHHQLGAGTAAALALCYRPVAVLGDLLFSLPLLTFLSKAREESKAEPTANKSRPAA